MPKIGNFDTDATALLQRVQSHDKFGTAELNDWIFSNMKVSEGSNVLDVGCGFGKQTMALLKNGCAVVSVDASEASIEQLQKSAEQFTTKLVTIHSEFDSMLLPQIEFDYVVSAYAFYYSQDRDHVLSMVSEKMKKGSQIFICGPAFDNNQGMKDLLGKAGVTFGEGSAPFMEEDGPELFKKHFGNVEKLRFENVVRFPSADEVWRYWSSHNMFDSAIEDKFKHNLELHFCKRKRVCDNKGGYRAALL